MSGLTAVAMSGGLDSSVVAWLLSRQESPVIGLSMLLWDRSEENTHGRCCGALDLGDAKRVAEQCGIPHYTLRMDREFQLRVVEPFVQEYLEGRTPIPCTQCNTWIKFDLFVERARRLGADRIATGHYARILKGSEGWELHAAARREKDQSYYLFELTQEQLEVSVFPLGEMSKEEAHRVARQAELSVADKGESMEICFVSGGVRDFVEQQVQRSPERFADAQQGEACAVVDEGGRSLGRGEPYYRYTVGQRRGLGVATGERLYVLAVEPRDNRVVVGNARALLASGLRGDGLHWIGPDPGAQVEATVKIRSRHQGVACRIRSLGGGRAEVEFATPQPGVAPGQAAVFYQGSRVLGGCWIRCRL